MHYRAIVYLKGCGSLVSVIKEVDSVISITITYLCSFGETASTDGMEKRRSVNFTMEEAYIKGI